MKTFEERNHIGQLKNFEIENFRIGRRGVVRVLKRIPEVIILREPKRFFSWFREDSFCEFEIGGKKFEVEEPYGDNSRYWFGGPRYTDEFEKVAKEFKNQ